MDEIVFEVCEDEVDGGLVATALGHAIATRGDTLEELREMTRDAVRCHFGDGAPGPMPEIIRLQLDYELMKAERENGERISREVRPHAA